MTPEQQNRNYLTIAIYALIVILIGVACVFFCIHYDNVAIFFSKIADICAPILYGALIAYILNPLMKIFEEKVLRRRNPADGLSRTARRIFAVIMTYLSFFTEVLDAGGQLRQKHPNEKTNENEK